MCFVCLKVMQDNCVPVFNVLLFNVSLALLCFGNNMFSGFVVIYFKLFGDGKCFSFSRTFVFLL